MRKKERIIRMNLNAQVGREKYKDEEKNVFFLIQEGGRGKQVEQRHRGCQLRRGFSRFSLVYLPAAEGTSGSTPSHNERVDSKQRGQAREHSTGCEN